MWLGPAYYLSVFSLFLIIISIFALNFNFSLRYKFLSIKKNLNLFLYFFIILSAFLLNWLYLIFLISQELNIYFNTINIYAFPFVFIFIFITALSVIFCLSYNKNETALFLFYCLSILLIGFNLFLTNDLIFFFLIYEMLLIPSFFILYKFAKTRRAVEAAYLMFFWTQFGAIFLIFIFFYFFLITNSTNFDLILAFNFNSFESNLGIIFFLIGFGVKFPIWPFYGWLPKAHVEASTNFSIFLSGVLVKFAFFAFIKCYYLVNAEPTTLLIVPILVIGVLDSSFKLSYQIDLKKIVAYSTVIEMHWLCLSILSGLTPIFLAGFCMLVSHAFLSTNFFLLVDTINRRYKTRLVTEINSLGLLNTKLFILILINLLIFLGFPGSLFFIAEILFFTFLIDFSFEISIIFLIILYLIVPTLFFKSWWPITSGCSINLNKPLKNDLDSKELLLISTLTFVLFWLGFSWQLFLF